MEEGLDFLQTFNPIESKAELLEKTLIGREKLVDMLEELVIESATSGNKHQRLIIGPRGSGKTHLLRVLYNRAAANDELKDQLKIAYLCEDEYGIDSFLDFIIRILNAFTRWHPENSVYLNKEIDNLKKIPTNDQEKIAVNILLDHIDGFTLLIIVENIGVIFNGMGDRGQRKLRDLVQQYPSFTIMASNQALFKDVQYEDKPFHNFFKITHLKKLTLDETILFLKSIAEWEEKTDLLKFLDEPEGRGRIHAIYDLTGGNHRLLVTFYYFLKSDYKNDLSYSFIKTINDLIPYYQGYMNLLSPLQQKIVQYLCQSRSPANVKEIAENCFSLPGSISKQMSILLKLKYVDAARSGKETFYELSEPLLRICFEVKGNRGGPIKLFVDFLGSLYSVREIKRKYMQFYILSGISPGKRAIDFYHEGRYYKEALKQISPDQIENFKVDEFERNDKEFQVKTYIEELEKSGAYSEILDFTTALQQINRYLLIKEAFAYGKTGDVKKQVETAEHLLKENDRDIDALLMLAEALQENKDLKKSTKYFNKVLKLDKNNVAALTGLGTNLLFQDNFEEAEKNLLKVLEIESDNEDALTCVAFSVLNQKRDQDAYGYSKRIIKLNPGNYWGWTLLGLSQIGLNETEDAEKSLLHAIGLSKGNWLAIGALGGLYGVLGNIEKANNYLKKLSESFPEISEGWRMLGVIQREHGKIEEAKNSYLKAIELEEQNRRAIESLGILFAEIGDYQQSSQYFKKLTKLVPKYSEGWSFLGYSQFFLNEFVDAKNSYLKAYELDNNNLYAVSYIAILLAKEGNLKEAEIYVEKLLKHKDDPGIMNNVGVVYSEAGQFEKAIPFYEKAIRLDSRNHIPYLNLVSRYIELNNIATALKRLEEALKLSKATETIDSIIQSFEENLSTLFIFCSSTNISKFLNEASVLVEKYGYLEQFIKAIPQAIFVILIKHEEIETKRFQWIETILKEVFKENRVMIIPLKFLNIGIRHLVKKEKNALFQFTKEERNTFKKFVLDKLETGVKKSF